MAKTKPEAKKNNSSSSLASRDSRSGKFTVAPTAKPPKRFTVEQLRDAVRQVNASKKA